MEAAKYESKPKYTKPVELLNKFNERHKVEVKSEFKPGWDKKNGNELQLQYKNKSTEKLSKFKQQQKYANATADETQSTILSKQFGKPTTQCEYRTAISEKFHSQSVETKSKSKPVSKSKRASAIQKQSALPSDKQSQQKSKKTAINKQSESSSSAVSKFQQLYTDKWSKEQKGKYEEKMELLKQQCTKLKIYSALKPNYLSNLINFCKYNNKCIYDIYNNNTSSCYNNIISHENDFEIKPDLFGRQAFQNQNIKLNTLKRRDSYIKIIFWNARHLNNNIKKNFVKNLVNIMQPDIVFICDSSNMDLGHWNLFSKYTDNKNLLYIRNEIQCEVIYQENIFFLKDLNIYCCYVKPNLNKNDKIKWNVIFHKIMNKNNTIIGDLNLRTNTFLVKVIDKFERKNEVQGEETIQNVIISNNIRKIKKYLAPSDHKIIYVEINKTFYSTSFLKLNYIKNISDFNMIKNIFEGKQLDIKFEYKIKNSRLYLNDKFLTIRKIVNLYLQNNSVLLYKYFSNVWSKFKKEPLLGDNISSKIIESIKLHLKHNKNKVYEKFDLIKLVGFETFPEDRLSKAIQIMEKKGSIKNLNLFKVKNAGSHAKTEDFIGLKEIGDKIKIYIENLAFQKKWKDIKMLLFNLLVYQNNNLISEKSKVFYLIKNPKLENFQDVRLITIIPTTFRIYEALVYEEIVEQLNKVIYSNMNKDNLYQFGGLKYGGTLQAINFLKYKIEKVNRSNNKMRAIFITDIAFGYDSVDQDILDQFIKQDSRLNDRLKMLLLLWNQFNKNMDLWISNSYIKRSIGIPMGAALSPAIFIYYVDVCLLDCKFKNDIDMYIDDLTMILKQYDEPKFKIKLLKEYLGKGKLTIKEKKTFIITDQKNKKSEYDDYFEQVKEYKIQERFTFLGRDLIYDNNEIIPNDENIVIIDKNRIKKFPNWLSLSEHRLLFTGALNAKQRFISFMMSISSKTVRGEHLKNTRDYFAHKFDKLSYRQLMFSIENMFRFHLDAFQCFNLLKRYKENLDIIKSNNINNKVVIPDDLAIIFSDGSFLEDSNVYGMGGILLYKKIIDNNWKYYKVSYYNYGNNINEIKHRNVAGEVHAVIDLLKKANQLGIQKIMLYYDYIGLEKWALNEWNANNDLTRDYKEQMNELRKKMNIQFCKVKAHANNLGNEEADKLAKKGAKSNKRNENCLEITEKEFSSYSKECILFNSECNFEEQEDIINIIKNQIKFNHKELDGFIDKININNIKDYVSNDKFMFENCFMITSKFLDDLWRKFKVLLVDFQFQKYNVKWENFIYWKNAFMQSKLFNKHAFLQDLSFCHLDWLKNEELYNRIILLNLIEKWTDEVIELLVKMPINIKEFLDIDNWLNKELDNLELNLRNYIYEINKFNKNQIYNKINKLWKFLLNCQKNNLFINLTNKNNKEKKKEKMDLHKIIWKNTRKLIYNIEKIWYNKTRLNKNRRELILDLLIGTRENKYTLSMLTECEDVDDNKEDIENLDNLDEELDSLDDNEKVDLN